jgi:hypothetical protein
MHNREPTVCVHQSCEQQVGGEHKGVQVDGSTINADEGRSSLR